MLRLALIFCIVAILAALCGFGLIAGMAFEIARILFFVFLVLAIVALVGGYGWRRPIDHL
jgi:uncharacterized membrane protein YtjA (UPF0391 family)